MAFASNVRISAAALLVVAATVTVTSRADAQEGLAPVPPFEPAQLSPSLLDFVTGKPVATNCKSLFTNPLLRAPFAGQPLDSAKGLAAAIKAEKLDAKNRIKAVKFLGTVDCVTYPRAPQMLVTVLQTDRVEEVRYEAAKALREMLNRGQSLREKFCKFFGRNKRKYRRAEACKGCCSDEILNALARIAYETDEQCCPIEPSYRVRQMAIKAMEECPCYSCPTEYIDSTMEPIPPGPGPEGEPMENLDPGEPMEQIENVPGAPEASYGPGFELTPTGASGNVTSAIDPRMIDEQYSEPVVIEKTGHDIQQQSNFAAPVDAKTLKVLADFCVVGLYEGRFEHARSVFNSVYQGRKYHFANDQAKQEFDRRPQMYAPAYSGFDPVIARSQGEAIEGTILRRFQGRLYSFSSKESWQEFQSNPAAYAVGENN